MFWGVQPLQKAGPALSVTPFEHLALHVTLWHLLVSPTQHHSRNCGALRCYFALQGFATLFEVNLKLKCLKYWDSSRCRYFWYASDLNGPSYECSGPARFDWMTDDSVWVYRRSKAELVSLLEQELSKLLGSPVTLKNWSQATHICLHSGAISPQYNNSLLQ